MRVLKLPILKKTSFFFSLKNFQIGSNYFLLHRHFKSSRQCPIQAKIHMKPFQCIAGLGNQYLSLNFPFKFVQLCSVHFLQGCNIFMQCLYLLLAFLHDLALKFYTQRPSSLFTVFRVVWWSSGCTLTNMWCTCGYIFFVLFNDCSVLSFAELIQASL